MRERQSKAKVNEAFCLLIFPTILHGETKCRGNNSANVTILAEVLTWSPMPSFGNYAQSFLVE